tara:strand:+ start:233 stop:448 length:216 start_codon:yes stop_codon:yes gene_type:complete
MAQKTRNMRKNRRNRKGGKKTGLLETAAVPFGLLAIQHLATKKYGRKSSKTKKRKNKSYRNKKNKSYKKRS